MDLILLRHADALNVGQEGIATDEERPLSEKGRKQSLLSANGLLALDLQPDLILTSPLIRAKQTADILGEAADAEDKVEICPALAPGGNPKDLLGRITEAMDAKCVVCVGHLPDLGFLVSQFVFGLPRVEIPIKKAGICHLEIRKELDQAKLLNFMSAKTLAKLAEG